MSPIVLTLDAGGTNFVFSAIANEKEIVDPVSLPSLANDLDLCLKNIIRGFELVIHSLPEKPAAISFAFPGPADYPSGIIGDLGNLPSFRGGVALGSMLENHFQIPVFINNDGDLFTYGEAHYGLLPEINSKLETIGSEKRFHSLIGITLGTGFGGGLVFNNQLICGENSAAGEIWLLQNSVHDGFFAEESISARAIVREYRTISSEKFDFLTPQDIFQIAMGERSGDEKAALYAFQCFGKALGTALTQVITLFDAPVVIGGGLANAWGLFAPSMFTELRGVYTGFQGQEVSRLVMQVLDFQSEESFKAFSNIEKQRVKVPFSQNLVSYDPIKRIGVGTSRLGTSKAVALGAYAFAIDKILINKH